MGDGSIQMIIAVVICLILSGLFSATETAFSNFSRVRMKNLASSGNKRAGLVMKLIEDYDSLNSTILICSSIINITLATLTALLFVGRFPRTGALISVALTTAAVLIFGEVSPESIAKEAPDSFILKIAPLIRTLMIIFSPLNFLINGWKKLLLRIFKFNASAAMTEDELITIVDEAEQDGGINESEGDLIRSAIEFNDAEVEDIITPRVDVVAIDINTPASEIYEIFYKTGFSRLPVYDDVIDNIIGVLHEKDFYHLNREGVRDITSILGKALYVPSHVKISKLLAQFQQAKVHMAIVLDDYGGTMGIATLEDILEELVGDIWDEHDQVVELFTKNPDGSVGVSGNTRTLDMFDYFDIEPEDEDDLAQTVSGWVTCSLGSFPETGLSFDYGNLHVVINKTDGRTVEEITVTEIEAVPQSDVFKKDE